MSLDEHMVVYIPQNLEIMSLIADFPPSGIQSFHPDKLLYIIGLISLIPSRNRKLECNDGYVPINANLLKNHIGDYRTYLDYLIEAEVLECDYHYIPGKKSHGFRFTVHYMTPLVPVEIKKFSIRKLLKHLNTPDISDEKKQLLPYLQKWWNQDLRIDYDSALAWMNIEYIKNKPQIGEYKALQKYISQKMSLDNFNDHRFYFRIDKTVGRLHTNMTNMKSGFRNYITYDGEKLVSIDIKNSQPFLLGTLFNENFYKPSLEFLHSKTDSFANLVNNQKHSIYLPYQTSDTGFISSAPINLTLSILSENYDFKNINNTKSLDTIIYSIMEGKNELSLAGVEFQNYINLTSKGLLYEYIEDELKSRNGMIFPSRKALKEIVFMVFFTDNRFIGQKEAIPKQIFRDLFPYTYDLTSLIKRGDATTLPRLLQAIEAHIILNNVCLRISRENPLIPIFTIHDSIVCPVGHENYVAQVIKEETFLAIGLVPSLQYEFWTPEAI